MDGPQIDKLTWLPDLMDQVRIELKNQQIQQHEQQPDLEGELSSLRLNVQGWTQSLANKDLDPKVRASLEGEWAAAEGRIEEIEEHFLALDRQEERATELLSESDVMARLQTLSEVLANYGPTRGNLELSLHVDRITCSSDGGVELRLCKLGALPDAAEQLGQLAVSVKDGTAVTNDPGSANGARQRGPRRRGRLRTSDVDPVDDVDYTAIADFAADSKRFADLGDEWFWIDHFQSPKRTSWVKENAAHVWERFQEIEKATGKKPSLNQLAREFGKSRPAIKTALDIATGKISRNGNEKPANRKFSSPLDDEVRDKVIRLYNDGWQEKKIAEHLEIHRNSVGRILDAWDEKRGVKRPDGRSRRSGIKPAR